VWWWLAWGWLAGSVLVPATGMCVTRKLTDPRTRGVLGGDMSACTGGRDRRRPWPGRSGL